MFSPIKTLNTYFPLQFYICLFIDIAIILFGVILAVRLHKKGTFEKVQTVACIVLFVWSAVVLFLTLLGRRYHDYYTQNYSFELFSCYRRIIIEHNHAILISTLQNITMFVPIGFTLSVVFKKSHKFILPLVISFAFSLLIETGQLLLKSGTFELDDLFNNTLGALLGIIIYMIISGIIMSRKKKEVNLAAEDYR